MTFSCFNLYTQRVFKIPGKNRSMTEEPFPGKVGYLAVKASPALFPSALDQHLHHGEVLLQSLMHFRMKKVLLEKYLGEVFQNCECCLENLLLELQHLPGLATKCPT